MEQPSPRTIRPRRLAAALAGALAAACASPAPPPPAPVPVAVVDLARIGRLGVLDFRAEGDRSLEPVARAEFLASVRRAQPGAALLELGAAERVLATVGGAVLEPETIRAIGRRYQLDALLVAELRAEEIDPYKFMRKLRAADGAAEIEGALSARLYETAHGAALWATSAARRQPVTRVQVNAWGLKSVDPGHLTEVRGALVKALVAQATADFRPGPATPVATTR